MIEKRHERWLREALGTPPADALARSRCRLARWLAQTAPRLRWDAIDSPLGPLYFAASDRGLCSLDFGAGADLNAFLAHLDPLAHAEHDPQGLSGIAEQLREYFAGRRQRFDLPLDLGRLTSFQRSVLQAACAIPYGSVRSYGQLAQTVGRPHASRAVGQALGSNPIPIVIPCHRVVASDGSLGGYTGGLEKKRFLLELERTTRTGTATVMP